MKSHHYGSIAVIIAAILWSLDGLLRKQLFSLPSSVIVFWEHIIGLLVLVPVVFYFRKQLVAFTRQQWGAIIFVAFLSGALGTILFTEALTRTQFSPFSVVVLLQQLQPVFAITAAAILLKEKVTRKFVVLAGIAIAAAYFVSFPDLTVNFDTGDGTALAALFAICAAAAWGVSTAFSKYSLKGVNPLQATAARFAFAPIFALLFVLLLGDTSELGSVSGTQWWYIIAITFSTGLAALGIYYFGLKRIRASRSTILELAFPVSAVVVGFVFLDESFTWTQWLGAVVLSAVIFTIARLQTDKPE